MSSGKQEVRTNLGLVTAYGYAKSKGYTGTAEEFASDQANFARNATAVKTYRDEAEVFRDEAKESADWAEEVIDGTAVAHFTIDENGHLQYSKYLASSAINNDIDFNIINNKSLEVTMYINE